MCVLYKLPSRAPRTEVFLFLCRTFYIVRCHERTVSLNMKNPFIETVSVVVISAIWLETLLERIEQTFIFIFKLCAPRQSECSRVA